MSNTATLLKDNLDGYQGHAALYRLEPPIKAYVWEEDEQPETHEFVVCSAVNAMFTGDETFLFPANDKGEVTSWGELPGSVRGTLSHSAALSNAGYRLARIVKTSKSREKKLSIRFTS